MELQVPGTLVALFEITLSFGLKSRYGAPAKLAQFFFVSAASAAVLFAALKMFPA